MRRAASTSILILLATTFMLAFNIQLAKTEPTTIVVPDDYPTIQEAIDAASSGDTILVSEGTYAEGPIYVGKSLTILANGSVIVDGLHQGNVFFIYAFDVTIRGFTIKNSGALPSYSGVFLLGTENCIVSGNTIINSSAGIWVDSRQPNLVISNNMIANNRQGILLEESSYVRILNNTITNNKDGIVLLYSSGNTINNNTITANGWGIWLSNSENNTIADNMIMKNTAGICPNLSSGNSIHHNNFINNTYQAYIDSASPNAWDNGYPSGGNYWSDYDGTDSFSGSYQNETGSDGIGDTPYILDADNQDRYPLMTAWEPLPGDLNWDGTINIYDIVLAVVAYGSKSGDTHWNPHCDIAEPYGIIDIYDIVMIAGNYGESW